LLYADSVVVPDPVFEWLVDKVGMLLFDAREFRRGKVRFDEGQRSELDQAVAFLREWQPFLSKGWLIVAPVEAERFYEFRALLRSREKNPALFVSWMGLLDMVAEGHQLTPTERLIVDAGLAREMAVTRAREDEEVMRALGYRSSDSMGLAIEIETYVNAFGQAASASARPLATQPGEWEYFLHRLRVAGEVLSKDERVTLSVVPALASSELPFISQASPEVLRDIRANEQAFGDWQLSLARAVRAMEALPQGDSFASEARTVLNEELLPAAAEVRRATSKGRAISAMAQESAMRLGLGALVGAGAVKLGVPVNYAAGSAGLSALVDLTVRSFRPAAPDGAHAVLARLLAAQPRSSESLP
jgi:hypothetical protein